MKQKLFFLLVFTALLFTSCNNDLGSDGTDVPDTAVQLIPKTITYTIPNPPGIDDLFMNFNTTGYPTTFSASAYNPVTFTYAGNVLTELRTTDNLHGNAYEFYYDGEQLDSIYCNCHNGVTSDQRTWEISYANNVITSEVHTLNWSRIYEYTFQTDAYQTLTQVKDYDVNMTPIGIWEYFYDNVGNPIRLERHVYNEATSAYDLNTVEEQTFDNAENFYKNIQRFHPIIEELYNNLGSINANNSRIKILNRKSPNNVLSRTQTFVPSNTTMGDLLFDYMYNDDNYPTSYTQTNLGIEVREYAIEYYED